MQKNLNDFITKFSSNKLIVKWENMGTWQKHSEFSTYAEAIKFYNIKITPLKDNFCVLVKLQRGYVKIELTGTLADLELYILKAIIMFNQFIGDKTRIISRFGTEKVNY